MYISNKKLNTHHSLGLYMKKLIFSSLFFVILFSACSELPTEGDQLIGIESSQQQFQPLAIGDAGNISLEKRRLLAIEKIDGSEGGELEGEATFKTGNGDIELSTKLIFSPGAFKGDEVIRYWVDASEASFIFKPSMDFNVPAIFSAKISNMNVSDSDKIYFVYVGRNGFELVDGAEVKVKDGEISITGVKLNHFSRYAFVK